MTISFTFNHFITFMNPNNLIRIFSSLQFKKELLLEFINSQTATKEINLNYEDKYRKAAIS